jgi:hypothetical protein
MPPGACGYDRGWYITHKVPTLVGFPTFPKGAVCVTES